MTNLYSWFLLHYQILVQDFLTYFCVNQLDSPTYFYSNQQDSLTYSCVNQQGCPSSTRSHSGLRSCCVMPRSFLARGCLILLACAAKGFVMPMSRDQLRVAEE